MKIAYYDIIDGKSVPVSEEEAEKRDKEFYEKFGDPAKEKENTLTEIEKIIDTSNISKENKNKLKEFIERVM